MTTRQLAQEVGSLLVARNATISLVETTTGGLIASALLAVPGASRFFVGGVNAYSLQARVAFLGIDKNFHQTYDGPNEQIVIQLAKAVQERLETTFAFAESGVCGPTLPKVYRAEIEVGYNPLAVTSSSGLVQSKTIRTGVTGREENMQAFALEGLRMIKEVLQADDPKARM